MTTFNTGNPIGSTDARDRLDNSENMDILENSTTLNAHADRLGTMRKTRKGMELEHDNQISDHESEHDAQIAAHEVEHDNQMQTFESDFDDRLAGMAFTRVGTFAAGATLTDMRQTLLWELSQGGDGREYGWTGSFLPSGKVVAAGSSPTPISAGNWVDRTEDRLRSDINVVTKRFSSVDDMLADFNVNPLEKAIGSIVSTGYTQWVYDNTNTPVTTENFRVFDVVNPFDFGMKGDGVTDDTVAIAAAASSAHLSDAELFIPPGIIGFSDKIEIKCSIWGSGDGTRFKALTSAAGLTIRTGAANRYRAGRVGNFCIDYSSVTVTADSIGMWLSKGTTPAANSGINNVKFSNISILGAYRGIQMLPTDLGNLWNVKFENVLVFNSANYGIYIDATGSNGSLNVSFDTVTCDGFSSTTAKGAFIRGIGNLKFFGTATANTGVNLSALWVSDCTNVDVRLQIENITVSAPLSQGLIGFTNCPSVELSLVSQTCTFNQGAGNLAHYVYLDSNVKSFIFNSFLTFGDAHTSGTTYKVNVNSGSAWNGKLSIVDPTTTRGDFYATSALLNATRFHDTNYSLEKTQTTRRIKADSTVTASVNVLTNLLSTAAYAGVSALPSGLYLVQGMFSGDSSIGFTDLIMVASAGPSQQKVVAVNSQYFGANHVRTYSINSANLAVTIAHTSGSYKINVTGIDQVGAA